MRAPGARTPLHQHYQTHTNLKKANTMKMNKPITAVAVALAIAALASVSASAQTVSAGASDLVLGFQTTDQSGTGAFTDLEVDLGDQALFTKTASFTLSGTSTGLTAADLTSTYGSSWATRGDLTWGVAGVTDESITNENDDFVATLSSGATASDLKDAVDQSSPYGVISSLANGLNGQSSLTSSKAAAIGNSSNKASSITSSWTSTENNGAGNADFTQFNPSGVTEVNGNSGNVLGTLSLYYYTEGSTAAAVKYGTFSLTDTSGNLLFTYNGVNAVAAPEPSAYALGICAVLLFLVLRRRQSVA